jgi:hypothetical protein
MKKMIILAMSCISTLVITDATAMSMFTRLRQPAQRLTTSAGRTRAFSTITTTQSRAVNDAEEALKKLNQYQEDFTTFRKQNADALNQRSWFQPFPNLNSGRSEALVKNLSEIESKFTQAIEEMKKELAKKEQENAQLKLDRDESNKKLKDELQKRINVEKVVEDSNRIGVMQLYPWKLYGNQLEDQTVKE